MSLRLACELLSTYELKQKMARMKDTFPSLFYRSPQLKRLPTGSSTLVQTLPR